MFRRLSLPALRVALPVALLTASLAACHSNDQLRATTATITDTLVAYSLNGTPAGLPSGLNSVSGTTVQVTGAGDFDIAFDLTSSGQINILPVRTVVSPLVGTHTVGLLRGTGTFDSITRAPDGYYRADTAMVVSVGEPFIMIANRSSGASTCLFLPTPKLYAKVVVDSINSTTKAIYIRQVIDPNCGYRSFAPGFPAN